LIIVEPLGGLGNQLFVYSLGLANARRLGVDLVADLSNFSGYRWHSYELDSFQNSISGNFKARLPRALTKIISRVDNRTSRLSGHSAFRNLYLETDNQFDSKFLVVPDGARLRGYFQSWKYLSPVANELRATVWALTRPSEWFMAKKEELSRGGPWIGIHMRLGNYITLPGMGIVPATYYERALSLLSELGYHFPVVVFSDSPKLVQEMSIWRSFPQVSFFDSEPANSPIETMLLMSLAPHLIIGNSSFSWWAGWLGDMPGRKVTYPRPWINSKDWDDRDLAVPGWLGISSDNTRDYE